MSDVDNKTTVEAGVLSNLVDLFFKGMGKILDYAAEYQEEMGVLKSITRIPVADADGEEYTFVVKLSPVRDKENTFYVESEVLDSEDKPVSGFNLDEINKKALLINRQNQSEFDKRIEQVLKKNKLTRIDKNSEADEYDIVAAYADDEEHIVTIHITETPVQGQQDRFVVDVDPEEPIVTPKFNSDKVRRSSEIDDAIDKWLEDNGMFRLTEDEMMENPTEQENIPASKSIDVTLRKITASNEVELVASKIRCNVTAAADMLSEVSYADDFLDQLTEEPTTYRITEYDDDYDVEKLDEDIEQEDVLGEFASMVNACKTNIDYVLDALSLASPDDGPYAISSPRYAAEGMLANVKEWYFAKNKKYLPNPIPPTDLVDPIQIDAPITRPEDAYPYMRIAYTQFEDVLNLMYPNLEHQQQAAIDDALLTVDRILAKVGLTVE